MVANSEFRAPFPAALGNCCQRHFGVWSPRVTVGIICPVMAAGESWVTEDHQRDEAAA
jgi:hypothetical protein